MLAEHSDLVVRNLTPAIGAEILTDAETLLSGCNAKAIRALLEERGVLLFRDVHLDDEQQIAFTNTLGMLAYDYNGREVEGKKWALYNVSLDQRENPLAYVLKTSFYWHFDGSMSETPILASILTPRRLSPSGGETEFCNTYAAYAALPEAEKAAIEKLRVVHANWWLQRYADPEPTHARLMSDNVVSREQPLVWTHRSGRKSLVLGATAAYVVGKEPFESMEILVRLRDWATHPQFVYRHEWRMGDLVIWDNTGTLHRARPYPADSGRLMRRSMLQGEEPVI
jgi:alpha-ketoglutarate-dependent taurine dioxygenase